jgi:hypothetical protein
VPGGHFFSYAVAECDAELSDVATRPGDDVSRELREVHTAFYDNLDEDEFYAEMVEARRLVVRLHVRRVYGILLDRPRGA